MKKNFLKVIAVATLLAVSLGLAGCNSAGGEAGESAPAFLSGNPVSAAAIQYALDHSNVVVLDSVTISGNATIKVPAGKTLKLLGTTNVGTTITLDASKGTLDISDSTAVAFDGGGSVLIVANTTVAAAVVTSGTAVVAPLVNVSALDGTFDAAVQNITLAGTTDLDASELAASDLGAGKTLIVLGTATQKSSVSTWGPSGKLKILGTLSVTEAFTIHANVSTNNIDASATAANALTIATATGVTITTLTGTAPLVLNTTVVAIDIKGGTGNVDTKITSPALKTSTFGNTGTTTFSGATPATLAGSARDIVVKGDLYITGTSFAFTVANDTREAIKYLPQWEIPRLLPF